MKYVFKEYDSSILQFFRQEKQILSSFSHVEHVGSTAVLGLVGKGILDIAVGVDNLAGAKEQFCSLGYEWREHASTSERYFFRRHEGDQCIHLHVTIFDSKDWNEMLHFRDYLRAHPDKVAEYARIKKEAALQANGDGEKYRTYKEDFIQKILSSRFWWQHFLERCNTHF